MWKLFFFNAPEISHINTQRYTTKLAYFLHYLWQTQAVRKHHFLSNEEARTETERLFSAVSRISSDFICMPRHFSLPQIPLFLVLLAFFFFKESSLHHYTRVLPISTFTPPSSPSPTTFYFHPAALERRESLQQKRFVLSGPVLSLSSQLIR